jgi:hypothetical protein
LDASTQPGCEIIEFSLAKAMASADLSRIRPPEIVPGQTLIQLLESIGIDGMKLAAVAAGYHSLPMGIAVKRFPAGHPDARIQVEFGGRTPNNNPEYFRHFLLPVLD